MGDMVTTNVRIGHGYDIHRLIPAKDASIFLGGVEIPFTKIFVAHSDGDVLIHALCDAMLGAAGLGDIGQHFPDTDPDFKDCHSNVFLSKVMQKIARKGFHVVNIDATIIAEKPKLMPFIEKMKKNLNSVLNSEINIKAKTHERCDAVGQEDAIAAHVVVLLEKVGNDENIIK